MCVVTTLTAVISVASCMIGRRKGCREEEKAPKLLTTLVREVRMTQRSIEEFFSADSSHSWGMYWRRAET